MPHFLENSNSQSQHFGLALPTHLKKLIEHSRAENTQKAYQNALTHFINEGFTLPATSQNIADYLSRAVIENEDEFILAFKISTLRQRIAALSMAHKSLGHDDPTLHPLVKAVLSGIVRQAKQIPKQSKPLLKDNILNILHTGGMVASHRPIDVRNTALITIGFLGAFRRSELSQLTLQNLGFSQDGLVITLQFSKTSQTGELPVYKTFPCCGKSPHSLTCPVGIMLKWLDIAQIKAGRIFRSVNRHGQIGARLSPQAVDYIIKKLCKRALKEKQGFSAHSLRAGFITSCAQAGVPLWKIQMQSGHKSINVLSGYIRKIGSFSDNAVSDVWEF